MFRVSLYLVACGVCLGGCLERHLMIVSDPPGATVTANDVELGRTPLEADITYYGEYDVKVEKEGFEPLRVKQKAGTPIYEYVPLDLLATAIPATFENTVPWKFKLEPAMELTQSPEELNKGVLERGRALREKLEAK